MTFSIVARSEDGESWGVAVASKFLAVGSAVPAAVAGVGAIATQAMANSMRKILVFLSVVVMIVLIVGLGIARRLHALRSRNGEHQ